MERWRNGGGRRAERWTHGQGTRLLRRCRVLGALHCPPFGRPAALNLLISWRAPVSRIPSLPALLPLWVPLHLLVDSFHTAPHFQVPPPRVSPNPPHLKVALRPPTPGHQPPAPPHLGESRPRTLDSRRAEPVWDPQPLPRGRGAGPRSLSPKGLGAGSRGSLEIQGPTHSSGFWGFARPG